jgi:hypothetical protein
VQADRFYTIRNDGLKQPWFGRVWLNPPYDRFAPKFAEKLALSLNRGDITAACALLAVHHMTTKWFGCLLSLNSISCLPNRRLKFSGTTARPTHGSVIIGFGVEVEAFRREFEQFGHIWD